MAEPSHLHGHHSLNVAVRLRLPIYNVRSTIGKVHITRQRRRPVVGAYNDIVDECPVVRVGALKPAHGSATVIGDTRASRRPRAADAEKLALERYLASYQ
jgi:hypothetical protein